MDAIRRTSTLRRVAMTASLAALLIPAAAADAKAKRTQKKDKLPVITSVSPMRATVGEELTIKGKYFRKGKARNGVGFKRDGAPVVFIRSSLSTERMMVVPLTAKLERVVEGGTERFGLRVLTSRFGKRFTAKGLSPLIRSALIPPVSPAGTDCDDDGTRNADDPDDDNDLLSDELEARLNTAVLKKNPSAELLLDPCAKDSDSDGAHDGFEYKSAVDLNDDEYRRPNTVLPYPGKRPYPNPLFGEDVNTDFDGDSLTVAGEFALWRFTVEEQGTVETLFPLGYSDGMQYSVHGVDAAGRRVPALPAAGYDRGFGAGTTPLPDCEDADNASKATDGFKPWAERCGYAEVTLQDRSRWVHYSDGSPFSEGLTVYNLFNLDRLGPAEILQYDVDGHGMLSDDERDEDADGLSNYVETSGPMSGPEWWSTCYPDEGAFPVVYAGTSPVDSDSDGDSVRDGADDQDHDDVPNIQEISRVDASGGKFDGKAGTTCKRKAPPAPVVVPAPDPSASPTPTPTPTPTPDPTRVDPDAYGWVNPFNPCLPDRTSRTCPRYLEFGKTKFAPFGDHVTWLSLH